MTDVLIIAPADDLHAQAVECEIRSAGRRALVIDSADFPLRASLAWTSPEHAQLLHADHGEIDISGLRGVWWRRPLPPDIRSAIPHPSLRRFVAAECRQALLGVLCQTPNFFNSPGASRDAATKLRQLTRASALGLAIPRTLVTTQPQVAVEFAAGSPSIFKTFTGTDFGFFETRPLTKDAPEDFARLMTCPLIFQEHIEGRYDIRATVVDDQVFAARILFREGTHPVDSRAERLPMEPETLPLTVARQLIALVNGFGLRYGAIDLRRTNEDDYVFFEINPEGQYLWTEIGAGLPISQAVARALLRGAT